MKIAFFGTSDRSVPILNALKEECDLSFCVTKNDVLVGRNQEKKETEVKVWCKENNIPYVTISSLKGPDLENVIRYINDSKPDYLLVADFGFIIPDELLQLCENKFINIHFSLLPKYRGSSPVQFAILNGEEYTGVTYLLVVKKLDAGNIIKQIGYKMSYNETSDDLYKLLFDLAAENVCKVLSDYDKGILKPIKQENEKSSYTYSPSHPNSTQIYKEDSVINWEQSPIQIERFIRAFFSWPIARTTLGELEKNNKLSHKIRLKQHIDKSLIIKIYKAELTEDKKISILTLQVEGKNKINWEDFVNGYCEIQN